MEPFKQELSGRLSDSKKPTEKVVSHPYNQTHLTNRLPPAQTSWVIVWFNWPEITRYGIRVMDAKK
jgi:hypothetical protein